jgi:hypothetical protein
LSVLQPSFFSFFSWATTKKMPYGRRRSSRRPGYSSYATGAKHRKTRVDELKLLKSLLPAPQSIMATGVAEKSFAPHILLPFFSTPGEAEFSYFQVPVTDLVPSQQPVETDGRTVMWQPAYRRGVAYKLTKVVVNLSFHYATNQELVFYCYPHNKTLGGQPFAIAGDVTSKQFLLRRQHLGELGLLSDDGPFRTAVVTVEDKMGPAPRKQFVTDDGSLFTARLSYDANKPYAGASVSLDEVVAKRKKSALTRRVHLYLTAGPNGEPHVVNGKVPFRSGGEKQLRIEWDLDLDMRTLPNETSVSIPVRILAGIRSRSTEVVTDPGFDNSAVMCSYISSLSTTVYYSS